MRLGDFAALRTAVLSADGTPASDWWPLAYAMQRIGHADALPVLRGWLTRGGALTRAFAVKGLGGLKDAAVAGRRSRRWPADARQPMRIRVQAIRGLGAIADARSAATLTALLPPSTPAALRLEAAAAIGAMARPALAESLIDYLEDDWAPMRAAAQAAMARSDVDAFMPVLSGLFNDPEWSVRAALATTLGALTPEAAGPRLTQLAGDTDPKVVAAALRAMTTLKLPGAEARLTAALAHADPAVRVAAAEGLGALKPAGRRRRRWPAPSTRRAPTPPTSPAAAVLAALAAVEGPGGGAATDRGAGRSRTGRSGCGPRRCSNGLAPATPVQRDPAGPRQHRAGSRSGGPTWRRPPTHRTPMSAPPRGSCGSNWRCSMRRAPSPTSSTLVRKGFFDGVRLHRVCRTSSCRTATRAATAKAGPATPSATS